MFIAEEGTLLARRGRTAPAPVLTPVQKAAANELLKSMSSGSVLILRAAAGLGRTTVLQHVHSIVGGAWLGARQFIDVLMVRRPDAVEQAFVELLEDALDRHQVVILDDFHLITAITGSYYYPRRGLLETALEAILGIAEANGKKIVFGYGAGHIPGPAYSRAHIVTLREFAPADFAGIVRGRLAERAGDIDFDRVHRAAPALNAHQLVRIAAAFSRGSRPLTDAFIEHLAEHNLTSNVDLEEVQAVDWKDLRGMDDVLEALEAKIALPFENGPLAAELQLKPKRGVLLAGPPGTGKTTIGRALAHRLKGKFFLIDGTVIAGSPDFHEEVSGIFEKAKRNGPAIIFIDDSDVIFEGRGAGFYRYLLTMLDGLESAGAERVCVMMTAMDVSSLPGALLRSGRIELWLETRLPDDSARRTILSERLCALPEPLASVDVALLAESSRHLTGADLKSIVEDGKLRFAYDVALGRPPYPAEQYFLQSIAEIRLNRRKHARSRPSKFGDEPKFGF